MKVPGNEITLAGQVYVMPALSAAAVKQNREKLNSLTSTTMPDVCIVAELAYLALRRNYPDITQEFVDDVVDFSNMLEVYEALVSLNSLVEHGGKLARRLQEMMLSNGLTMPSAT